MTARRNFLRAGGALLVTASMAACELSTDPASKSGNDRAPKNKGAEAPSLATLVEGGDLPPVEERLPATPLVVEPNDRIGTYGGTWRSALLGPADTSWLGRTIGYESLMRWDVGWTTVIPNVAESVEMSDDGRVYTITLRSGMRWSDGELFTADDLAFAYEDVHLNESISPVVPSALTTDGTPLTLRKIDDLVVEVTFSEPNGLFLTRLALDRDGSLLCTYPRHYLEQFHIEYNPDADQLAKDEGLSDWVELFTAKASVRQWENPDAPTLHPWILTSALGEGSRVVAERNPFYWKVDPDGSQLPYIDQVVYDVASDEEVILLKATNGELDFHTRHINTLQNKPILAASREEGEYDFVAMPNSEMNEMVIAFNLTHKDPMLREIFQNRDFRVGLSHAIDRDEMINAVFQRQGLAWQAAPAKESDYYDEEFATQYLQYDVDLANDHLDRAGYDQRDDDGFRLRPDGERIVFDIEVASPALIPVWPDAMELVVQYWQEVGIQARIRSEDRSLLYERKEANEHDANVWKGDGGFGNEIFDPRWYFPFSTESNFAIPWANWYSSLGEVGEEPPEPARRQMELYGQFTAATSDEQRSELFQQIITIAKEQFYAIGTVRIPEKYGIVANNFHNVPASIPEAGSTGYNTPAPVNAAQFFVS